MTTSINIHRATNIVFERHMPNNGNSVTLIVTQQQASDDYITREVDVTIFDLPADVTRKLYEAFGEPNHKSEDGDFPLSEAAE